ncbi:MAG: chemotaxis response regulator protein-glutamate methylesterase [Oligoflexia bacterium]|nr:MAG: chemotaxis response regulator protein-glutamate methylesterase [Oligoflexia bacterium]
MSKTEDVPKKEISSKPVAAPVVEAKEASAKELVRTGKVKVLIIDDSKTIRNVLKLICSQDPDVEVIGEIEDPLKADEFLLKNKVDVITLDIHMPGMDGVQLLAKIHPKYHIPTVMISALSKDDGPYVLNALEIGAVDYIQKPSMDEIKRKGPEIVERIKTASLAHVKPQDRKQAAKVSNGPIDQSYIVAIGSSTGGTEALKDLLTQLPAEIPPILIVQHIPAVFSAALATRLNGLCKFEVKEASDMDPVKPGCVLIAPGGRQMKMAKDGKGGYCVRVTDDPAYNRHRPSVDFLFESIAELAPPNMVGVILTGMGSDGARGLLKLKNKGAWTIAQDAASCVVYGMPRSAVELGAHQEQLPLMDIPSAIVRECQQSKKAS